MRTRPQINMGNIRNDKMSDIKKFYGWSERQLEQQVRTVAGDQNSRAEIKKVYTEAYGKKE